MKDLGEADVILNIKLIKKDSRITLSQSHYVEKVLSQFGFIDSKPSPTPYDPSVTLRKNKKIARDQLRYCQIIDSLMYLASATRPDISFTVCMSNPGNDHWHTLERVFRYLKGTMSFEIHYSRLPLCKRDIVMRTGFLILIKSTPLVGMFLLLEVAQCHGGLVNKLL
jgi:hypothetical protein